MQARKQPPIDLRFRRPRSFPQTTGGISKTCSRRRWPASQARWVSRVVGGIGPG